MDQINAAALPPPSLRTAVASGRPAPIRRRRLSWCDRRALRTIALSFCRFLAVGCAGLASDALLFSLLDARGHAPETARAVSLAAATLVTWALNRRFTFDPSRRAPPGEFARYAAVTLLAQGLSYGVFLALVYGLPAVPKLIALVTGAALAAGFGFLGHRFVSFAPARPRKGA